MKINPFKKTSQTKSLPKSETIQTKPDAKVMSTVANKVKPANKELRTRSLTAKIEEPTGKTKDIFDALRSGG